MKTKQELEQAAMEVARKLYLYDTSYVDERRQAFEEWDALLPALKKAGLDWKDFLPYRNCEGERLW